MIKTSIQIISFQKKMELKPKVCKKNSWLFNLFARRAKTKQNLQENPARQWCFFERFWIWIWYDEIGNFWIYIQILYPFWQKDIYPDHISSNWIYILDIISLDIYPTQCWNKHILISFMMILGITFSNIWSVLLWDLVYLLPLLLLTQLHWLEA